MPEIKKTRVESKVETQSRLMLIDALQNELIRESREYQTGGDSGAIDWIVKNAQNFRRIFEGIWEEIENDQHYAEAIQMMENGDNHVIKEQLLKMIKPRLKE